MHSLITIMDQGILQRASMEIGAYNLWTYLIP